MDEVEANLLFIKIINTPILEVAIYQIRCHAVGAPIVVE